MATIGRLNYQIVANTSGFTKGMVATRQELNLSKRIMRETRTPAESLGTAIDRLGILLRKGAIDSDTYHRAVVKMKSETPEAIAEQQAWAKAVERGKQVTAAAATPLERFSREVSELRSLLKRGHISQETYTRSVAKLKSQLPDIAAKQRAAAEAQQELTRTLERGRQIAQSVATPLESFKREVADLRALLSAGAISQETYTRKVAALKRALPGVAERHRQLERDFERGRTLLQQLQSPLERYQRELEDLRRLLRVGAIDQKTFNRSVEGLQSQLPVAESRVARMRRSLNSLGRMGGTIGSLAGVSVGIYSIGTAARSVMGRANQFAQKMASSTAIVNDLTDETRAKMEQAAKQVAFHTKFSTAEAAESYFFLESAGLSAEQSILSLPVAAKFAQAGMFDMSLATDLLTDAQSALGLTVDDAQQNMTNMAVVSDVLVRANTLANASVEQFSKSLTNKAGAALKIVNKDIAEGVAVLAAFADQGVKDAEAGTALNIVFRDLQTKALENAEAFERNRVAVFDAAGEMRNTADILQDLERRMTGLSDAAKKEVLIELGFSDKSVAFTQMLVGNSVKIRRYEKQLRSAGGATAEVADRQLPPLTVALNKLSAVWDAFAIQVATPIAESFAGAAGEAGTLARILASLVDVGTFFAGTWKLAAVGVSGLRHPIATLEIMLATLQVQAVEFVDTLVTAARSNAVGRKLIDASGFGEQLDKMKAAAAANFRDVETRNREHIDNLTNQSEDVLELFDRLFDANRSPGQQLLDTITAMQQPLANVAGNVDDLVSNSGAEVGDFSDAAASAAEYAEQLSQVTASLAEQIATLGMSREETELWKLEQAGVPAAVIANVRAMQQELQAMKDRDALMQKGKQLTESLRTPLEIYNSRLAELDTLLAAGAISQETFTRAIAEADKSLRAATENNEPIVAKFETRGLAGLLSDSAEAMELMRQQRELFGKPVKAPEIPDAEMPANADEVPVVPGLGFEPAVPELPPIEMPEISPPELAFATPELTISQPPDLGVDLPTIEVPQLPSVELPEFPATSFELTAPELPQLQVESPTASQPPDVGVDVPRDITAAAPEPPQPKPTVAPTSDTPFAKLLAQEFFRRRSNRPKAPAEPPQPELKVDSPPLPELEAPEFPRIDTPEIPATNFALTAPELPQLQIEPPTISKPPSEEAPVAAREVDEVAHELLRELTNKLDEAVKQLEAISENTEEIADADPLEVREVTL